jgi:hypothetical protein
MGLDINMLKREPEGAMYVSPERLCVTAEGEICANDDARAVRLLVAKGGSIPAREAAEYGLISGAAASGPPADQADEEAPAAEEETAPADEEETTPKRKR